MNEKFRKKLERDLVRNGIASTWHEMVLEETEVKADREAVDETDIGVASDGTRYVKSLVIKYLTEKGYPMTQESVDLAAKLFVTNGDSYIQKEQKRVRHSDFDDVDDDDFVAYLTYKIAEQISKTNLATGLMTYTIDVIRDVGGATDTNALMRSLNYHSERGWKLKSVFTNELGKNSFSVAMNGVSSGTNSTVDQVVLIYERPAYMNDKTAKDMYDQLVSSAR